MSEKLPPQPWTTHSATRLVMEAMRAAGGDDCARFVGGCVRDALLRKPVTDIDIATKLDPSAVTEALTKAGIKAIPTGIEHGTVTAATMGRVFEITTLRRDVETDGRHARVEFTDDWEEDAARRDFRFNALYADDAGTVFDPTGHGVADLRAGKVVFVGDPSTRITEDALRIPRFFRFLAWYGRGKPDTAALQACQDLRELAAELSAERVSRELLKLFNAENPAAAVRLMAATQVLGVLLPQAEGLTRFEGLVKIETEQLFSQDPLLRIAALLHDDPGAARATAEHLRLSNGDRDRLVGALSGHVVVSWMSPREVRREIWRQGAGPFARPGNAVLGDVAQGRRGRAVARAVADDRQLAPPAFPLSGDEVLAAGVPPGPMVGKVLREIEAWWIDADFTDDKLALIERLKSVTQGMAY